MFRITNGFFFTFATMKFTANQIAEILDGDIVGNADVEVYKLSKIEKFRCFFA